ncbi:Na+/H+ antiporter family protein [Tepidimicrobium xylanilyticum]|uniref:Na+/H+ antiporter family protein n=1 Tax=Tepidimicrobium xylanilyticum TaxID=1123352 RepID=UPI00264C635C|nr:Na+/H+ antiporter family protein [Tepidimicrobium xylanilyticum]GMG97053.1 sodium:proton antiporter [Tepidimicrobium xylanilyticum]
MPVVVSVLVMAVLCLLKLNVIIALIISALVAGVLSGISMTESISLLIAGMGGNSETALSYILLGALAVAINKSGIANRLVIKLSKSLKDKRVLFVLIIAFISCFSQNLIPVHIAFIPILIPPLLGVMNKLKIDRRAVACALTFGLKAPYIMLPVGFGLIFHNIIRDALIDNGMPVTTEMIWKPLLIPGAGMIIGLLLAIFIAYRKPREYEDISLGEIAATDEEQSSNMTKEEVGVLIGAIVAFAVQLLSGSLALGILTALLVMLLFGSFKFKDIDNLMDGGIRMMGFIAFVMLVASGYGNVLRETGAVEALVNSSVELIGGSKLLGAILMLLIGLLVTMGIGTSFGTVPIIATFYVPLCIQLGFSPAATIALVGVAGALGDAGSPASDSTLGPTSGLNADGQHDHIWDTCVPTFTFFNIPLLIFGTIAAMIL